MKKALRRNIRKKQQKQIALHRIHLLCSLAQKQALKKNYQRADRYIHIARNISMKTQTPIPHEKKRIFCKHCYRFMLPGQTCRVRIHRGKIIMFCKYCKSIQRFPIHPKR